MEAALGNLEPLLSSLTLYPIDQTIGACDPARPPPLEIAFQRLGLTRPLERRARAFLDDAVEALECIFV